MVGNDVVDIAVTRRRTRHARFDARVFGDRERAAIAADADEEVRRWAHWAAKESAYKVAKRADAATVFSPVKFEVELDGVFEPGHDGELSGRVRHGSAVFPVTVSRRGDCVHAVAAGPGGCPTELRAAVGLYPDDAGADSPSRAVRRLAIRELATLLATPARDLVVRSTERIPRLLHRDGRDVAILSLSHHGRFVAYACRLPDAGAEASP
jgi:phosphopantetheinyl transferase (holo-ACP synthase)